MGTIQENGDYIRVVLYFYPTPIRVRGPPKVFIEFEDILVPYTEYDYTIVLGIVSSEKDLFLLGSNTIVVLNSTIQEMYSFHSVVVF